MKIRSILFAFVAAALATPAIAQEAPQTGPVYTYPSVPQNDRVLEPAPRKHAPSLMEEQEYFWGSRHFQQPDVDDQGNPVDNNRVDLYMPHALGNPTPTIEIRGYGQIFAPGAFYNMFRTITNDTTGLIYDATYYEQFRDAKAFTIDTVVMYWYKNPSGSTPLAGATFYMYGSPNNVNDTYFNTAGYKANGMKIARSSFPVLYEQVITPEEIDATLGDNQFFPTQIAFDPPMQFQPGKWAMPFIINDDAEAVHQLQNEDVRDFQIMRAYWERRTGKASGFGSAAQDYKALGVLDFRPYNAFDPLKDTMYTLHSALVFTDQQTQTQMAAVIDNLFLFSGTVDINASIRFHYGRRVDGAGLSAPTPNPVSSNTRIPFALSETSSFKLELFDVNGTHVRTIDEGRYVQGNYSAALNVDDLANGTYLVRMTAGESVYSIKVTVAK